MKELQVTKLAEQARQLSKLLTSCRRVKKLVEQKAWREVVQPLIEKMIADAVGGKVGNLYSINHLSKPDGVGVEFYVGYKQALMDLNNRVWTHVDSIKGLQERIKLLEKKASTPERYKMPMEGT